MEFFIWAGSCGLFVLSFVVLLYSVAGYVNVLTNRITYVQMNVNDHPTSMTAKDVDRKSWLYLIILSSIGLAGSFITGLAYTVSLILECLNAPV